MFIIKSYFIAHANSNKRSKTAGDANWAVARNFSICAILQFKLITKYDISVITIKKKILRNLPKM